MLATAEERGTSPLVASDIVVGYNWAWAIIAGSCRGVCHDLWWLRGGGGGGGGEPSSLAVAGHGQSLLVAADGRQPSLLAVDGHR